MDYLAIFPLISFFYYCQLISVDLSFPPKDCTNQGLPFYIKPTVYMYILHVMRFKRRPRVLKSYNSLTVQTKCNDDVSCHGYTLDQNISDQTWHTVVCNWDETLVNKPYVNEVTLRGAKTTLKMLLASWFLTCFLKGFRSFDSVNMGSVD